MNIIISGWPGVGQSTLSIILAKTLNYKLLQGTSTFRYLGSLINLENTGADRIKADEMLEPNWGPVFEKYMQWVANNESEVVSETDISGFFTKDNKNVYSVFLQAPQEIRKGRLVKDGRKNDVDYIQKRDESLSRTYKKLFNVDFLDMQMIADCYTRPIDNSRLSIEEELIIIYNDLLKVQAISEEEFNDLVKNAKAEEKFFWENGKQAFVEIIKTRNQLPTAQEIIKNIMTLFPSDIQKFPDELKNILAKVD